MIAATCLAGVGLVLALPATSAGDSASRLRAKGRALAAQERSAVLELYALHSELDRVRGELASVEARRAAVRAERRSTALELRAARSSLRVGERRLGEILRALYEGEQPGTVEIILGATSLQDAIDDLDSLDRSARATAAVIDQVRAARAHVERLSAELARRQRSLDELRRSIAARASDLVAAQSERVSYVARLRAARQLNARQVAALDARARAAAVRAREVTVAARAARAATAASSAEPAPAATARATPPSPPPPPAAAQASPSGLAGKRLTVIATAYSLHGGTSSGLPTGPGIVAVDPTVIPMGTRMTIPGYGEGIAADTGSGIKGNRIDLWFPTLAQAMAWGAKTVTITLH